MIRSFGIKKFCLWKFCWVLQWRSTGKGSRSPQRTISVHEDRVEAVRKEVFEMLANKILEKDIGIERVEQLVSVVTEALCVVFFLKDA